MEKIILDPLSIQLGGRWESPIYIFTDDIHFKIEDEVVKAVQKVGIQVEKEELIKALKYDREQYEKGYADAKNSLIRCKDCKYYKQSDVVDRKMCCRKDVDGMPVCYDFLPDDWCKYGERKES